MSSPVKFSAAHYVGQESNMLHKLGWSLSAPTALCFLEFLVRRVAPRTPVRRRELRCRARELLRRSLPGAPPVPPTVRHAAACPLRTHARSRLPAPTPPRADRAFLPFKPSQVAAAVLKRALLEASVKAGATATATTMAAVDAAAGDVRTPRAAPRRSGPRSPQPWPTAQRCAARTRLPGRSPSPAVAVGKADMKFQGWHALTRRPSARQVVAVAACLRALDAAWPRGGAAAAPSPRARAAMLRAATAPRQAPKDGAGRDESPTSTLSGLMALDLDDGREASPDGSGGSDSASEPEADVAAVRIPRRRAFRGIATAAAAAPLLPAKRAAPGA